MDRGVCPALWFAGLFNFFNFWPHTVHGALGPATPVQCRLLTMGPPGTSPVVTNCKNRRSVGNDLRNSVSGGCGGGVSSPTSPVL